MTRRVLLFDIDGTLIRCGGAGGKSLLAAMADEFALEEVSPVPIHGRTDLGIVNQLLGDHGIECTEANRHRLYNRYYSLLPARLAQLAEAAEAHILPGVQSLLGHLSTSSNFVVGLLTGNMPTSARIKLEHFELWDHFQFGVFGNQADHRARLAEPAMAAIANHCGEPVHAKDVTIIGDTPLDVELAKVMGSRSLALCTGGFSADDLQQSGADLVLEDLSDNHRVLSWLAL